MNFSLGETEALCRKAAKGAGLDWGLAEEAGKAARWLQSFGQPGAETLLYCLEDRNAPLIGPQIDGSRWHSPDGPLCPLMTGACLSDHAAMLADRPVTLENLRHPLLLAAFSASAAAQLKRGMRLAWGASTLEITATTARLDGPPDSLLTPLTNRVTCEICDPSDTLSAPSHSRADLSADVLARLTALAQRTYAPATDASRIAGAGAGTSDND